MRSLGSLATLVVGTRPRLPLRARPSIVASCLALTLCVPGCASAVDDSDDGASESALSRAVPAKFVVASATSPSCIGAAPSNVPLAATGSCAGTPELTYHAASGAIKLASDPTQCLDVQFAIKAPGAAVMFHPCHGQANQTWRVGKPLDTTAHLASPVRVEAYAKAAGSNLCLASKDGRLIVDTCGAANGEWLLDRRVDGRLMQRGRIATSLLTFGMLESKASAATASAARSDALAPDAADLAAELAKRVMPALPSGEAPRVLLALDDAHHGENAGDAAAITQALGELLTRTEARLAIEVRLGVEITVTKIQAIIEDEVSRLTVELTERRTTIRLLVATALIVTTTKAKVELIDEPATGLAWSDLRMKDGKLPHVVWLSNPGHKIDDEVTIDSLLRFAQRGGGVVVQGDDAAQGTARLTGLDLRAAWAESNGHVYCGQNYDNGLGRFPLSSRALSVSDLVYTDDLDLAKVVDPRAKVLAEARPTCQGNVDPLPAVVFIDRDAPNAR